jgi:hypothetical protein
MRELLSRASFANSSISINSKINIPKHITVNGFGDCNGLDHLEDPMKNWEEGVRAGVSFIILIIIAGTLFHILPTQSDKFIALVIVVTGVAIAIYLKVSNQKEECNCGVLLVLTATAAIVFAIALHGNKLGNYMIIALVGVVALSVPLILAVTSRTNLGSRLDNGEIRKAIVISLTIVYIILLVVSFYNASVEGASESNQGVASYSEINKENGSVVKEHIYTISMTNISAYALELNLSGSTFILKPKANESSGAMIPLSENSTGGIVDVIPAQALADFNKNFLYVYLIIILFYFGSRSWENNKTDNVVREFLNKYTSSKSTNTLNTEDIIKFRYAVGDIGDREFAIMIRNLGIGGIKIKNVSLKDDNATLEISNENRMNGMVIKNISIIEDGKEQVKEQLDSGYNFDPNQQKSITLKMKGNAINGKMYHIKVLANKADSDEKEYTHEDPSPTSENAKLGAID